MPSVTVDQEEVVFDGGMPSEPSKIYDLLMGVLAEQGRVVVAFVVDGVDSLREESNPTSFETIEIFQGLKKITLPFNGLWRFVFEFLDFSEDLYKE